MDGALKKKGISLSMQYLNETPLAQMKKVIVIDNNGEEVKVDLKKFVHHINLYHKTGISIHDESGHYFTVDDNLSLIHI